MKPSRRKTLGTSEKGFGLIELLLVLAIMGLVVGAIQGLYIAHQRSATTEGEAVDVQQNLRIGMDQMMRDISMAGFMVNGANPVSAITNGASGAPDTLVLNTGTQASVAATVGSATTAVTLAVGNFLDLSVMAFGSSIGGFEAAVDENVSQVRIVNYRGEPLGTGVRFTVIQVNPTAGTCGSVAAPCMRLRTEVAGSGTIDRGDTIVKTSVTGGAEGFPQTVTYNVAACPAPLAGNCLMRATTPVPTGGATVVATNVTDLQFSYLLAGTVESAAPAAADLASIRAIRVTLIGQLVDTAAVADGNLKPRTLSSIFAIRNVNGALL
jgi:prepilin-type N-terminal cleavage/methylation domain-containing protein